MRLPRFERHFRTPRFVLAGAAALLIAAGGAMAQGPGGGFGGLFGRGPSSGPMTQETVDRYTKMLGLTPEQKDKVKAAYNSYRADYDTEEAAMQEKVNEARKEAQDSGDPQAMRNAMAPMREFADSATKMEKGFLGEFKNVLTPDQASQWTKLERAMRREKAASGMMVASGEKTDLVQVVDKLELERPVRASLDPLLDQYEQDLDKELAARAKVNEEVAAKLQELRPQGGGGPAGGGGRGQGGGGPGGFQEMIQKMQPVIDKAKDASMKVQEVNRRYAAKVQAALPEDRRPAFIRAVKESRFPDVYRPSTAGRQLAAAMEMTDLDDKQKASVKALKDGYTKQAGEINEKLAAATEKDEAERMAQPGLGFGRGPGGGGGGNSDLGDLRQDKRDLDRDTMDSLAKILTKDQVAKLPKQEQRNFGGFGGPGGGGQGGPGGGNNQGGGRRNRGGGGGG